MRLLALFLATTAWAGGPACPDLTGIFASDEDEAYGIEWIWNQQACAKITQQGRSGNNYGEVTEILTDGIRRRPCPTCPWTTMSFTETALVGFVEDVSSDHCNERHTYRIDERRDVVDDWTYECPDAPPRNFQTIYHRHQ